jgi:hypothetical protein
MPPTMKLLSPPALPVLNGDLGGVDAVKASKSCET